MDAQTIMSAISTLGFPIVVAIALFWKMNEQDKDHKSEIQQLTNAVQNNTLTMQKLIDKLDS